MVDATMAASDASTVCIATKYRPRYSAFWQIPKMAVPRHCSRVRCHVWPSASAIAMPRQPEIRKRIASAVTAGASATIIRALVKADDHISAKARPIRMARMSRVASTKKGRAGRATPCAQCMARMPGRGKVSR